MKQFILGKVSDKLTEFLEKEYGAEQIQPVDYLLYNARQQVMNLFYPEAVEKITEESGFSPEADEEVSQRFDEMIDKYDREEAGSQYSQYRFVKESPEGAKAVFYVTVEKNTGFVLPQYEWDESAKAMEEISEEEYRFFNRIIRDILLAPYGWAENLKDDQETYERFITTKEYWDSMC